MDTAAGEHATVGPVNPVLKPGLRRLWRDDTTLQLGSDPSRAVVLTNLTPAAATLLDRLDGSRTREALLADCDAAGRDLLAIVEAEGLVDDAAADSRDVPVPPLEQDRFVPDVAAMSLRAADPTYARRLTNRRRRARLRVQGGGRVGAQVATLLAAGGIGTVVVDDAGVATPADVAPAGLRLDDVGRPRSVAATAALARVRRLPSSRRPGAAPSSFRPDLVVVAPVGLPVIHPTESLDLERSGFAHLLAGVRETTGVVGPLVVPGRTSCLHCQHLHRSALNPSWPLLALQMSRRNENGPDACDVTLATFVASLAAMQALDFIDAGCRQHGLEPAAEDRGPVSEEFAESFIDSTRDVAVLPAAADGTLELAYPDWRIRRRSWPVHSACPCRRARQLVDATADEPHGLADPGFEAGGRSAAS